MCFVCQAIKQMSLLVELETLGCCFFFFLPFPHSATTRWLPSIKNWNFLASHFLCSCRALHADTGRFELDLNWDWRTYMRNRLLCCIWTFRLSYNDVKCFLKNCYNWWINKKKKNSVNTPVIKTENKNKIQILVPYEIIRLCFCVMHHQ